MRISDWSSDVCSSDLRFYVPVRIKFCLSLLIALTWTGLSVWLSLPWVDDLGRLLGRPLALGLITFIAYVPGLMNAFLLSTILLDRPPVRRVPAHYPSVTLPVACYHEDGTSEALRGGKVCVRTCGARWSPYHS